ncbi:hypothetical protein ACFLXH_06750, partial [Chloroflexota bacterium]
LLAAVSIGFMAMYIMALGAYLEVARHTSAATHAAMSLLKTPAFIVGVLILGMGIPVVLLIYSLFVNDLSVLALLAGINGLLILLGGFLQRYSVVRAGTYLPLYPK